MLTMERIQTIRVIFFSNAYLFLNALIPANIAFVPYSSSIINNLLNLAICPKGVIPTPGEISELK